MTRALRRTALGLLALLPIAVVAAAGALVPAPGQVPAPAPVLVSVPPVATTLVCPGPLRLITESEDGDEVVYDPEFGPTPVGSVTTLTAVTAASGTTAGAGVLAPLGGGPGTDLLAAGPAGALRSGGATTGTALTVRPEDDTPAWAAAAVATVTTQGDLRGLAAASCQAPTTDAWLVGGGTEIGTSARLVLQNAGATPATVTLELWGAAGRIELAGSPEFLVPAASERAVLLEGVAAEQRRVVAHLTSAGGSVTAYLQDSRMRGLVPTGVDLVVAGAGPATTQVLAGLTVTASTADDTDPAILRLLSPTGNTTARVTLLGEAGPRDLAEVDLVGGEVLDLPLGGLEAGQWTAVVTADLPVVAGAAATRPGLREPVLLAGQDAVERAWIATVVPGTSGAVAVPDGVRAALSLGVLPTTPEDAVVTVEVIGVDGDVLGTSELTVAAGTTSLIPVPGLPGGNRAAGLVIRSADPRLAWALPSTRTVASGELLSVLVPVAPPTAQPDVTVGW